jgi:hypothetical protein
MIEKAIYSLCSCEKVIYYLSCHNEFSGVWLGGEAEEMAPENGAEGKLWRKVGKTSLVWPGSEAKRRRWADQTE